MVKVKNKNGYEFYVCGVCGFEYKEKIWAEKCQNYCNEKGACSLEITSHAVQMNDVNRKKA